MTTSVNAELKSFLAGYFHEDWEMDTSDPDQVISLFLAVPANSNEACRIAAQIIQYLDLAGDDVNVERALLKDYGCYYLPSADGLSAREWLRHVAGKLQGGWSGLV